MLETVNQWLPLLSLAGVVLFGWGMWHLSRSFVTRVEHEAIQARLADMEKETHETKQTLNILSVRLDGLPRAETVAELRVAIAELRGEVGSVREVMSRVERTLTLLTEHHMNEG